MAPGLGLPHLGECTETWWFPRAHGPTSFRIAPKALAPASPRPHSWGTKPHLPADWDSQAPLSCPHETRDSPWCIPASFSSSIPFCLPPSFPFRWKKPCSWLRLYFFCLLPNPSPNGPPQKDAVVLGKPAGGGRSAIPAARPFTGSRLPATSTRFLGRLIFVGGGGFLYFSLSRFLSYS